MRQRHFSRLAAAGVVLTCAVAAMAIDDGTEKLSPRQRAMKAAALTRELSADFQKEDYKSARQKCLQLIELQPDRGGHWYNLACCEARLKNTDDAFKALAKAVKLGWDNVEHMKADKDLADLRDDKRFAEIVKEASKGVEPTVKRGKKETVVTGKAAGGLHYRLRLAASASEKRPHRLIVWLHPSGGSGNSAVEAMAETFRENGFALLVFTKKSFIGWSEPDFKKAWRTVKELEKVKGLDVKRPLLMGYSAGGQMALNAWGSKPEWLGGLILDAAYPLDMSAYARGQVKAMDLPRSRGVKDCPIFVLVGSADGGSKLWKQVEKPWTDAGVPLEVHYVKGGRHQWLFGKEQTRALGSWLTKVRKADAKRPTTQPADAKEQAEPEKKPAAVEATRGA